MDFIDEKHGRSIKNLEFKSSGHLAGSFLKVLSCSLYLL